MSKPTFENVFMDALRERVILRPSDSYDLTAKMKFWHQRIGMEGRGSYDPFGHYGAPRHFGQIAVHEHMNERSVKVVVIRAGKRAGKSSVAVAEALWALSLGLKVWVVSATLELCKGIFDPLWRAAITASDILEPVFKDKRRYRMNFANGGAIIGRSWGEGVDGLEAEPAGLMLIDEGQKLIPDAWGLLFARTTDTNGKIMVFGSEQENSEFFDDICDQAGEFRDTAGTGRETWRFGSWTTYDNPHMPREALQEAKDTLPDAEFRALFMAERRPSYTTVYPEFRKETHVADVPYLSGEPVTLWIDPGYNVYAVLAAQFERGNQWGVHRERVRIFDEIYSMGTTNAAVIHACKNAEWWPDVAGVVMDVAGRQHRHEGDGGSSVQEWADTTGFFPRSRRVLVPDQIERVRTFLVNPDGHRSRIIFDRRCVNTIDEFKAYRYRLPRNGVRPISDMPKKEYDHALNALAYGLVDRYNERDNPLFGKHTARPAPLPIHGGASAVQAHKRAMGL